MRPRTNERMYPGIAVWIALVLSIAIWRFAGAEESAMWGFSPARNLASDEENLPVKWDPATGLNIKWKAALGSQTYAGPVIIGGQVFVSCAGPGFRGYQQPGPAQPKADG